MQQTPRNGQMQPHPMRTPMDLFVHELSDIYSAEQIILDMLEFGAASTANGQIKQGLLKHRDETRQQSDNVRQCFTILGQQPHPVRSYAADGLMMSLQEGIAASESELVTDGLLVAGARKTESLEIASYTGLIQKAQLMGQTEVLRLLQQNLNQEKSTLQQIEQISIQLDQQAASIAGAMMGGDQATANPQ
jgi:ferritin-like metal-binding protein YciE